MDVVSLLYSQSYIINEGNIQKIRKNFFFIFSKSVLCDDTNNELYLQTLQRRTYSRI
jgi:hypothetical protein